jgi:hypothetical protein
MAYHNKKCEEVNSGKIALLLQLHIPPAFCELVLQSLFLTFTEFHYLQQNFDKHLGDTQFQAKIPALNCLKKVEIWPQLSSSAKLYEAI